MNHKTELVCPQCSVHKRGARLELRDDKKLGCEECGAQFKANNGHYTLGRMEQDSQSLLSHQIDQFERKYRYNVALGDDILASILELVNAGKYRTVADVGCGFALYARILEGTYESYYGLEPSDVDMDTPVPSTIRNGDQSAMLIQYDPSKGLPLASTSTDLALMIGSYDHIEVRAPVIQEVCRILSTKGRLILSMTNSGSWLKRLLYAIGLSRLIPKDKEHYCHLSVSDLVDEVTTCSNGRLRLTRKISHRLMVPNVPLLRRTIFQIPGLLPLLEWTFAFAMRGVLRIQDAGTYMVLEFTLVEE